MKFGWIIKSAVMTSFILLIGAGCGGFGASQSISPLDFLLPSLGHNKPGETTPKTPPAEKPAEPVKVIALAH